MLSFLAYPQGVSTYSSIASGGEEKFLTVVDSPRVANSTKVMTVRNFKNNYKIAKKDTNLAQFSSTTSAQLAGVLSDETGTGIVVYSDSPDLTGTPTTASPASNDSSTMIANTKWVKQKLGSISTDNMATANLTFTASRTHTIGSYFFNFQGTNGGKEYHRTSSVYGYPPVIYGQNVYGTRVWGLGTHPDATTDLSGMFATNVLFGNGTTCNSGLYFTNDDTKRLFISDRFGSKYISLGSATIDNYIYNNLSIGKTTTPNATLDIKGSGSSAGSDWINATNYNANKMMTGHNDGRINFGPYTTELASPSTNSISQHFIGKAGRTSRASDEYVSWVFEDITYPVLKILTTTSNTSTLALESTASSVTLAREHSTGKFKMENASIGFLANFNGGVTVMGSYATTGTYTSDNLFTRTFNGNYTAIGVSNIFNAGLQVFCPDATGAVTMKESYPLAFRSTYWNGSASVYKNDYINTIATNVSGATKMVFNVGGVDRLFVHSTGSVVAGNPSLTTTAVDGFVYIPTSDGKPTGVPTSQTGYAPIQINATDGELNYHTNSKWVSVAPIQTADLTLSSAQIKALYATPITVITSPGAGKYIEIVSVTSQYTYATAPYATNTTMALQAVGASADIITDSDIIAGTVSKNVAWKGVPVISAGDTQLMSNAAIEVTMLNGEAVTGAGTVKLKVLYRIISE